MGDALRSQFLRNMKTRFRLVTGQVRSLDRSRLEQQLQLSGPLDPEKFTLFSIFRDEMYFVRAFFNHYRSLGIEQFLIVDDHSEDGTREYLLEQPDCVVIRSQYRYGERVIERKPYDQGREIRAGVVLKSAIPQIYLRDAYSVYADADEFLILPPGFSKIQTVIDRCQKENSKAVAASLVDFFPEKFSDLKSPVQANSLDDLLSAYPNFHGEQVIDVSNVGKVVVVGRSKNGHLFEAHLSENPNERGQKKPGSSSVRKVPIQYSDASSYRVGPHSSSDPVSTSMYLAIAHFTYTSNLKLKVDKAIAWESHAAGAKKYKRFNALAFQMNSEDASFLDEHSLRYRSPEDLVEAGLMRW